MQNHFRNISVTERLKENRRRVLQANFPHSKISRGNILNMCFRKRRVLKTQHKYCRSIVPRFGESGRNMASETANSAILEVRCDVYISPCDDFPMNSVLKKHYFLLRINHGNV